MKTKIIAILYLILLAALLVSCENKHHGKVLYDKERNAYMLRVRALGGYSIDSLGDISGTWDIVKPSKDTLIWINEDSLKFGRISVRVGDYDCMIIAYDVIKPVFVPMNDTVNIYFDTPINSGLNW